ncbi:MAG: ABC transporter substrate-binding protein [Sphaerochaetaceae bacterium]
MKLKKIVSVLLIFVLCIAFVSAGAQKEKVEKPDGPTLKIGVLGVMSGAGASWGLVTKYSTEAIAEMYNREGGFEIDGVKYRIEVITEDTRMDARVSRTAMEKLIHQDKIKYIVGTNIDDTTASAQPVLEAGGGMNVSYGFHKDLFKAPHYNTFLGMPTPYNSAPIIYDYTMKTYGVKTISFVARNDSDSLFDRDEGVEAARNLGLRILSHTETYEPGTTDFYPIITRIVRMNPDQIVLSGVAPGDAPLIIKVARELGFKGVISTETGQDAIILSEIAGNYANGFLSIGSASSPEFASDFMNDYMKIYSRIAGEWNDEAGTKAYALYMILQTLKIAGSKAIDDVEVFKAAVPNVKIQNPFVNRDVSLSYIGSEILGHPRQLGVPLVVNEYRNGSLETIIFETEY